MRLSTLSSVVFFAVLGCSASNQNTFNGAGAGGAGAGSGTGTGTGGDIGIGGGFTTGSGGGTAAGCDDAAKLVYVLSTDNDLYSFEPASKAFKKIGPLKCQTSMTPNSMAVDRNAVAWVNYVESDPFSGDTAGAIYKVSTKDATCQPTSISLGSGWYRLGMGFSSDAAGSDAETLYVAATSDPLGGGSPGLGKIDFAKNKVVPIGQFSGSLNGESAELTGTGDAKLYGFFTTSPVQVAEINKSTGATASPAKLNQVLTPSAWAFSFWGGSFYLYTSDGLSNSNVNKYDPATGTTNTAYVPNAGFIIVGAGVSTCAPIKPPA